MKKKVHAPPSPTTRFSTWIRQPSNPNTNRQTAANCASQNPKSQLFKRCSPSSARITAIFSISIIYAATVALVIRSIPDFTNCDLPSSTSRSGWHDTDISAASQGKLWTAQKIREFPSSSLLYHQAKNVANPTTTPIPRLLNYTCTNWAVVTTIFPPSQTLHQLRALTDWCLVVVGDRKTDDKIWQHFARTASETTVYLSASAQFSLPYHLVKHIPWHHFGRKNLGYVFAIHHGARLIWDTDDDNVLQRDGALLSTIASVHQNYDGRQHTEKIPLLRASHPLSNPYPFFRPVDAITGDRVTYTWPRGLPLPLIKSAAASDAKFQQSSTSPSSSITSSSIGATQSLADSDPDVDALYRLSHPLPIHFTSPQPHKIFALPLNRYAPFNAQATLWTFPALFATLLPVSVHGRVSDIWRAYFAQTVFRALGLHVAFHSPAVTQVRNPHAYVADLQAEIPLYTQAGALVEWLRKWKPPAGEDMKGILEALFVQLFEIGILEQSDVSVVQAWLSDLEGIGYTFSSISNRTDESSFNDSGADYGGTTEGPGGHEMLDGARVPDVAVCLYGNSSVDGDVARSVINSVHKLFSNSVVTLFALNSLPSACSSISDGRHTCVAIPPSPSKVHLAECMSAISTREVKRDEAFHWVFSIGSHDELRKRKHNNDVDFLRRLPGVIDASMNQSTVFRSRCEFSILAGGTAKLPAVMFGKPQVMREVLDSLLNSERMTEQSNAEDVVRKTLWGRGVRLTVSDDVMTDC